MNFSCVTDFLVLIGWFCQVTWKLNHKFLPKEVILQVQGIYVIFEGSYRA